MNINKFATEKLCLDQDAYKRYKPVELLEACLEYAEGGNSIAMYNSGLLYSYGSEKVGIQKDINKANKWLSKSTEPEAIMQININNQLESDLQVYDTNNSNNLLEIGLSYLHGSSGRTTNTEVSKMFLKKSKELAEKSKKMSENSKKSAHKSTYTKATCSKSHDVTSNNIKYNKIHSINEGISLNETIYNAERGNVAAMVRLGLLYSDSNFIENQYIQKNKLAATYWFNLAISSSDNGGQIIYDIATSFHNGINVKLNYNTAKYWFERGAASCNTQCMKMIAAIYRYGIGNTVPCKKNTIFWYTKCIENGYCDETIINFFRDCKDMTILNALIMTERVEYLTPFFGDNTNLLMTLWKTNKEKDKQIQYLTDIIIENNISSNAKRRKMDK